MVFLKMSARFQLVAVFLGITTFLLMGGCRHSSETSMKTDLRIFQVPSLSVPSIQTLEKWEEAFAPSPRIALAQHWQDSIDPGFQPASIRFGWTPDALYVFAEISDTSIHNPIRENHVPSFLVGDVFELFITHTHNEGYHEIHVTPQNHVLQLEFPDAETADNLDHSLSLQEKIDPFLVDDTTIWTRTFIDEDVDKWYVVMRVPAPWLGGEKGQLIPGQEFRFLGARYDHAHAPDTIVLSATAYLTKLRFHCLHEWATLKLAEPSSPLSHASQ